MEYTDKFQGQAGSFKVNSAGERELVEGSVTQPHPEGDAPRDPDGKRLDMDEAQKAAASPQDALPKPAETPPWATPAAPAPDQPRKRTRGDNTTQDTTQR